jgi:hypothetical protein
MVISCTPLLLTHPNIGAARQLSVTTHPEHAATPKSGLPVYGGGKIYNSGLSPPV